MKTFLARLGQVVPGLVVAGIVTPLFLNGADAPPAAGNPPPNQPARGDRGNRGDRGPQGNPQGGFQGRGGLGMDDQQRQLFRDAMMKHREAMAKLDEQLRAAQKELVKVTIAETYDEKIVREKAEAVAKIQVEMTLLRCQALSTVAPTLKPEQREELLNGRMGAMMLSGGFMDFGGGGFGGRGFDRGGGPGGGPPGGQGDPGRGDRPRRDRQQNP
jgi:Spy/CpxP family protein refolding chaperone